MTSEAVLWELVEQRAYLLAARRQVRLMVHDGDGHARRWFDGEFAKFSSDPNMSPLFPQVLAMVGDECERRRELPGPRLARRGCYGAQGTEVTA